MTISNTLVGRVFTDNQGNTRIRLLDEKQLSQDSIKGANRFAPVICEDSVDFRNGFFLVIYNLFIRFVNTCLYRKWERVQIQEEGQPNRKMVWLNLYSLERRAKFQNLTLKVQTLLGCQNRDELQNLISNHISGVKRELFNLAHMAEYRAESIPPVSQEAKAPVKKRKPIQNTPAKGSFGEKKTTLDKDEPAKKGFTIPSEIAFIAMKPYKEEDYVDVPLDDAQTNENRVECKYVPFVISEEDLATFKNAHQLKLFGNLSMQEAWNIYDGRVQLTPSLAKAYLTAIMTISPEKTFKETLHAIKMHSELLGRRAVNHPEQKEAILLALNLFKDLCLRMDTAARDAEQKRIAYHAKEIQVPLNCICRSNLSCKEIEVLLRPIRAKLDNADPKLIKILKKLCGEDCEDSDLARGDRLMEIYQAIKAEEFKYRGNKEVLGAISLLSKLANMT